MKTIFKPIGKFFVIQTIGLCLFSFTGWQIGFVNEVVAQPKQYNEYTYLLAETGSLFLFSPDIIKDVFYGLVELKGDQSAARNHIDHEVLGCPPKSKALLGCRIDHLKQERKQKQMPQKLKILVNFTSITASPVTKSKKRVHLKWQPETFQPPVISLKDFLEYIHAAKDSPYYQVKPGISRIQLNSLFERDVSFITDSSLAESLINVYQPIPDDYKDSITFDIDYIVPAQRGSTMDYLIQFKALSVMINHQVFNTAERVD